HVAVGVNDKVWWRRRLTFSMQHPHHATADGTRGNLHAAKSNSRKPACCTQDRGLDDFPWIEMLFRQGLIGGFTRPHAPSAHGSFSTNLFPNAQPKVG